jgi:hypothetical protein
MGHSVGLPQVQGTAPASGFLVFGLASASAIAAKGHPEIPAHKVGNLDGERVYFLEGTVTRRLRPIAGKFRSSPVLT